MTTYNKEEMFEIKEMFTIWNLCTENVDGLEVMSLLLPNGFLLFDITSSESFCLIKLLPLVVQKLGGTIHRINRYQADK